MRVGHLEFRRGLMHSAHCHRCGQSSHLSVRPPRGSSTRAPHSLGCKIVVRSGQHRTLNVTVARAFAITHAHGTQLGVKAPKRSGHRYRVAVVELDGEQRVRVA
jgi:hypothetical protein